MNSDEQIAAELQQATAGLLMMSESDYPFDVVRWEQADEITPDALRRIAALPPDAAVVTESLDDFLRAAMTEHEGQSAEARASAQDFRRLVQRLKTNLQDVRVYKVGTINLPVYIMGRTPSGNWLGLSTRIVET